MLADFNSAFKPAILAAADVFVSPADNLQETFGLSLVEAMAAGLPVVAGDFSGYRDFVQDGATGFLLPSWGPSDFGIIYPLMAEHVATLQVAQRTSLDLKALVERLALLAGDRELRLMGQAGWRRVLSRRFDLAVVVNGMKALWDKLNAQALIASPAEGQGPEPDVMDRGLEPALGHFVNGGLHSRPLVSKFLRIIWANQLHHDLAGSIATQTLEAVLGALERLGGQSSPRQVRATQGTDLPAYQVEHVLRWGLKYGLLAMV
jgi:hypothetical protein